MKEPITTEMDVSPSYPMSASDRSSISSSIDNSTHRNDWGPWVTVCAIIASLALGCAISSIVIIWHLTARASVSENHWRAIETDQGIMRKELDNLEVHHANNDRR